MDGINTTNQKVYIIFYKRCNKCRHVKAEFVNLPSAAESSGPEEEPRHIDDTDICRLLGKVTQSLLFLIVAIHSWSTWPDLNHQTRVEFQKGLCCSCCWFGEILEHFKGAGHRGRQRTIQFPVVVSELSFDPSGDRTKCSNYFLWDNRVNLPRITDTEKQAGICIPFLLIFHWHSFGLGLRRRHVESIYHVDVGTRGFVTWG